MVQHLQNTTPIALVRSVCAAEIAEILYRADKGDLTLSLADCPFDQLRSHYVQTAEAMVQYTADRELRDVADMYAADCIRAESSLPTLEAISPASRVQLVRQFRAGLNAWLRVLQGMYPGAGLEPYRRLVMADRAAMQASQATRSQMRNDPPDHLQPIADVMTNHFGRREDGR